jgi:hypothetical protein
MSRGEALRLHQPGPQDAFGRSVPDPVARQRAVATVVSRVRGNMSGHGSRIGPDGASRRTLFFHGHHTRRTAHRPDGCRTHSDRIIRMALYLMLLHQRVGYRGNRSYDEATLRHRGNVQARAIRGCRSAATSSSNSIRASESRICESQSHHDTGALLRFTSSTRLSKASFIFPRHSAATSCSLLASGTAPYHAGNITECVPSDIPRR